MIPGKLYGSFSEISPPERAELAKDIYERYSQLTPSEQDIARDLLYYTLDEMSPEMRSGATNLLLAKQVKRLWETPFYNRSMKKKGITAPSQISDTNRYFKNMPISFKNQIVNSRYGWAGVLSPEHRLAARGKNTPGKDKIQVMYSTSGTTGPPFECYYSKRDAYFTPAIFGKALSDIKASEFSPSYNVFNPRSIGYWVVQNAFPEAGVTPFSPHPTKDLAYELNFLRDHEVKSIFGSTDLKKGGIQRYLYPEKNADKKEPKLLSAEDIFGKGGVERVYFAGASMPKELLDRLRDLGVIDVCEGQGTSEQTGMGTGTYGRKYPHYQRGICRLKPQYLVEVVNIDSLTEGSPPWHVDVGERGILLKTPLNRTGTKLGRYAFDEATYLGTDPKTGEVLISDLSRLRDPSTGTYLSDLGQCGGGI
ncbi:MAG: hypothetical protein JW727_06705 [Candidatus Aenigmarchaeota archaeon]|nr:hypothetical protein [Candidatus Aenigmarchaeota archaeon]